jgi:hypothetical protein
MAGDVIEAQRGHNKCNDRNTQTYYEYTFKGEESKPQDHLERREKRNTMRMQEPEQRSSSEADGTTDQEYGAYGAEAQEQRIYPGEKHESRVNILLSYLTIGFSATGFGAAVIGMVGSAIVLGNQDGSRDLLTGGILGFVGSILALMIFATIFVLALVSEARRQARSRRSRFR